MPLTLVGLILVIVASLGAATYVYLGERGRRGIVGRASADPSRSASYEAQLRAVSGAPPALVQRIAKIAPAGWATDEKIESQLVQAGHDAPMAPLVYAAVRVMLLIALPLLTALIAPKHSFNSYVLIIGAAAVFAWLLPMFYLARTVRIRQETIRRQLPDALDLLVVCIEAGISLDAAILRVSRDLGAVHPELAREFLVVNRKTNAGMTREEALRGLWHRTGVTEIRGLVSHIIQGEKWGTSSGRVLRVYSETLRRRRRQAAEKKAATAPIKMLVPLALFIFPALLLVIMGPIVVNIMKLFEQH